MDIIIDITILHIITLPAIILHVTILHITMDTIIAYLQQNKKLNKLGVRDIGIYPLLINQVTFSKHY